MTEVVAGSSGAFPAPPGYFERVREICDKYDILLIVDEVITGFGRCGEWFGIQTEEIEPDIITFAKGLTSSYIPLGGIMINSDLANHIDQEGLDIGHTFAGHPVGCAAGLAAIEVYEEGLIENVCSIEPQLKSRLTTISEQYDHVSTVRGRGLLWSIKFAEPQTEEPLVDPRITDEDNPLKQVLEYAADQGVLFGLGRPGTQIMIAPPFCINPKETDMAMDTLESAIDEVF
jgi:taurine--2-oxoglutarate transaminase